MLMTESPRIVNLWYFISEMQERGWQVWLLLTGRDDAGYLNKDFFLVLQDLILISHQFCCNVVLLQEPYIACRLDNHLPIWNQTTFVFLKQVTLKLMQGGMGGMGSAVGTVPGKKKMKIIWWIPCKLLMIDVYNHTGLSSTIPCKLFVIIDSNYQQELPSNYSHTF